MSTDTFKIFIRTLQIFRTCAGAPIRGTEKAPLEVENICCPPSLSSSQHHIHRDIEDNSKLRRGIPVTHSIFGVATTINTANYAYFLALEKCHALQNQEAMDVFVGEMLNLHRGQGHDILWREDGRCPTEEQYLNMVRDKTGGLFRLSVGE